MFYRINIEDGYIIGVVKGVGEALANCTEEEFEKIKNILLASPEAEDGFAYRLTESLEWEKHEMIIEAVDAE